MSQDALDSARIQNAYCSFFMEGLMENHYDETLEKWDQGATELIHTINAYAAPLYEMSIAAENTIGPDRLGVFEYEICNPFGKFFAQEVLRTGYAPEMPIALAILRKWVISFFSQAQTDEVIQKLKDALAS